MCMCVCRRVGAIMRFNCANSVKEISKGIQHTRYIIDQEFFSIQFGSREKNVSLSIALLSSRLRLAERPVAGNVANVGLQLFYLIQQQRYISALIW